MADSAVVLLKSESSSIGCNRGLQSAQMHYVVAIEPKLSGVPSVALPSVFNNVGIVLGC